MAEEKRKTGRHILHLEERERATVSGVLEVVSFDEEGILLETACGMLMLKGTGLHVGRLDLESGDVAVNGCVDSIVYTEGGLTEKHSFLEKLFR